MQLTDIDKFISYLQTCGIWRSRVCILHFELRTVISVVSKIVVNSTLSSTFYQQLHNCSVLE